MNQQQYYGTGRRKTSVARVYLRPGNGRFLVNNKPMDEYFALDSQQFAARQPLTVTDSMSRFDVVATVKGGGITGQAEAVRHGVARALLQLPQDDIRPVLKKAGFLTRDAREVERKKYGQPGARRRYQFSKR